MSKLFALSFCLLLFSCGGGTSSNGSGGDGTNADSTEVSNAPKTKWKYSEEANDMDDSKTYIAKIEANEELQFEFPYNGGVQVFLILRKNSQGTDVMLTISKGQFLSNLMNNRSVKVRFDEKVAENYSYTDPADYSTTTIFMKNTKKFITGLKSAKQTIIQSEFYNEGIRTIKFDTENLEWNH